MKQETKNYKDKWKQFQIKIISTISYFNPLEFDIKEELYYKLRLEFIEKDTVIFTAGDVCKALYFVVAGEIDLLVD